MKQKNVWIAAVCAVVMLSACGGGAVKKERKSDREEMGLVGKVKVLVTPHDNDNGDVRCLFDEAGNLLRQEYEEYGPEIVEQLLTECAYGEDGKLVSVSRYSTMDGSLETKELYDGNRNLIALEKYQNAYEKGKRMSKLYSTQHFIYDGKGLLIKSYMNDDEKDASEYECDAAGNILKQTDYFNGKVSRILRFSYEYDRRGNITEECQYTPEIPGSKKPDTGKVKEKKEYKFDKNNFMLQQIQSTYTHDGKKHYLKQERTFKYTPDEHHNPIEVTSFVCTYPEPQAADQEKRCSEGNPVTMVYSYDEQGNWTNRKWTQNGQDRFADRRIEYYE